MSKIDSTYTTLAATFIIKQALNLFYFSIVSLNVTNQGARHRD